jgi:uroporphyrinogen III methyltransferase/synthase
VIQWGTTARQRTVTAPLSRLVGAVAEAGLGTPALVVIGPVVGLRERLAWFERRPLFGLRVLVPRSRAQPSRLARRLERLGAEVFEAPRLRDVEPSAPGLLEAAMAAIDRYDWLAVTSPTSVHRLGARLDALGRDARALAGLRIAAFGDATTASLRGLGIRADVALPSFQPAAAAAALRAEGGVDGARVLFLREEGPPSPLAARLASLGARVHEVAAYREEPEPEDAQEIRRRLDEGGIDVVALASSRTVRRFVASFGADAGRAALAAIGTETARTALSFGLPVTLLPGEQTLRGLIRGIREIHRTDRSDAPALAGAAARRPRLAPQP